jgi:hypothetical protein
MNGFQGNGPGGSEEEEMCHLCYEEEYSNFK